MKDYLWRDYSVDLNYAVDEHPVIPSLEDAGGKDHRGRRLINPVLRYSEIFDPLYKSGSTDQSSTLPEDARSILANLFFHFLARVDWLRSLNAYTLAQYKLRMEIEEGLYGRKASAGFSVLEEKDKGGLCRLLLKQEREGRIYFVEALKAFFPEFKIYRYEDEDKFLIYLPYGKSDETLSRLGLIEELFLGVASKEIEYFWEIPFGVIGEPETMRIGEFVIYGSREHGQSDRH